MNEGVGLFFPLATSPVLLNKQWFPSVHHCISRRKPQHSVLHIAEGIAVVFTDTKWNVLYMLLYLSATLAQEKRALLLEGFFSGSV